MSSMESVLRSERPERPGEFTFTWSVQNYSYSEENEWLCSPSFVVEFLGETRWFLWIYPKGDRAPGYVSCYLGGRVNAAFSFTLAVRMPDGKFKEAGEYVYDDSKLLNGYKKFASFEELKGPTGDLSNDTLTFRCRIWKISFPIPASEKWEALSRIRVSKLDYTWILNDIPCTNGVFEREFNKSVDITEFFTGDADINLQVYKKGNLSERSVQFGVEMVNPKKNYSWIAVVHLMDEDGTVIHSIRGEHVFQGSDEDENLWSFPLILENETNKNLCLPNNILILRCELSFSADSELETLVFRKTIERESTTMGKRTDLQGVSIKNMEECREERKSSDIIIRSRGQRFPVPRTLLSAHSEAFDAMFERDKKGRETGVVDIEDLDNGTVLSMLKHVHTNPFDVSDCPSALNLYSAADKYGMAGLKEKCSRYLMSCLDASNVCEILELADRHEDKDLESCARNFFRAHAQEIVASESWRKLKGKNVSLAFETVEWSICNEIVT